METEKVPWWRAQLLHWYTCVTHIAKQQNSYCSHLQGNYVLQNSMCQFDDKQQQPKEMCSIPYKVDGRGGV